MIRRIAIVGLLLAAAAANAQDSTAPKDPASATALFILWALLLVGNGAGPL